MNAIQQISLKLQLGLDPASNIQSEQLLEKWQDFNARKCRARSTQRLLDQKSGNPARSNLQDFRSA
ncbi:MAG TPA: hypothetical protein VFG52_01420 [Xanthomonadales bacterium]|nr:hypothetical protein [Xanthomonadales bacterium]